MLSEFIEPLQLAKESKILTGALPLKQFTRAEDLLLEHEGVLNFSWSFSFNQHQQVFAELSLRAELKLECQRCQKPFKYSLKVHIPMKLVHSETEAEALPLALQPLYVDMEGRCHAFEVIEDELILNIPEFPKHEKKDCGLDQNQAYYDTPSNGAKADTYKPFANLKLLSKEKK